MPLRVSRRRLALALVVWAALGLNTPLAGAGGKAPAVVRSQAGLRAAFADPTVTTIEVIKSDDSGCACSEHNYVLPQASALLHSLHTRRCAYFCFLSSATHKKWQLLLCVIIMMQLDRSVVLTEEWWRNKPIVFVNRSVTVTSSPGLPEWPCLYFNGIYNRLRLGNGLTLR